MSKLAGLTYVPNIVAKEICASNRLLPRRRYSKTPWYSDPKSPITFDACAPWLYVCKLEGPLFRWKSVAVVAFLLVPFVSSIPFSQSTQSQTINLFPIADQNFGVAPFQVVAIASSGLPVTLSVSGPATFNGRLLTITGVGAVTISAHQDGNNDYAPADAQETFNAKPGVSAIQWDLQSNPASIVYGTPLDGSLFDATATIVPVANPSADAAITDWQLNNSQITGNSTITVPATSPVFRYEGGPVQVSTFPNDHGGVIPDPTIVRSHLYRVAFTCDCQQFEFAIQTRTGTYRVWVDGAWITTDEVEQENDYPKTGFYRVQFPDKRPRQIKVAISDDTPFLGVVVSGTDTVSAPQTPIGPRAIIFGDSWSSPKIVAPALPPVQPGLLGSGHGQILGEYFNWEWLEDGLGGTGFINPGPYGITFDQRVQTDICDRNLDLVIVMGGINDNGDSEADVEQAVTQFLSDVESCAPNAKIIFIGPQLATPGVSDGIHAAVANFNNVIYDDPGAQNWFYGSSTDQTTGNAYLYYNVHPTPLGHDYWAEKEIEFILNQLPSMAPQTFPLFDPVPATGTLSYSAAEGTILPAGTQQLTVTFTPQDSTNYATVTQSATITVEKASSTTSLSSNTSSTTTGSAITLTATVSPQIGGVPTGTITFLDNGNAIGTSPLNQSASASFSTTSLTAGTHAFTATYSGDSNFLGSTTSGSISVSAVQPDFSFTLASAQLTVQPGQSIATTLTVNSINGLVANLTLACSGLPATVTCGLDDESQIAVNQATAQATLTVQDSTTQTLSRNVTSKLRGVEVCGLLGLAFAFSRKRRNAFSKWIAAVFLLSASLSLTIGCGSSTTTTQTTPPPTTPTTPPPASTTYTGQVTLSNAADPTMTHSQTITVVIP